MRRTLRIVGGFALALAVVGAFLWVVGPRRVLAELSSANLPVFAAWFVVLAGVVASAVVSVGPSAAPPILGPGEECIAWTAAPLRRAGTRGRVVRSTGRLLPAPAVPAGMSRRTRLVAGFALALLAVGGFLVAVGPEAVAAELATADLPVLAVGFLSVVVALACWSEAVRRLVATTGYSVGGSRYRRAYLSGEFLKQVLPMGQSGGPVLMSYTVSTETDAPYESTLAAASVFAFLNVVASLVLAVAGLALLVVTRRGPTGPLLRNVLVAMVAVTGVVLLLSYLAVYRRPLLERIALRVAAALRRTVGRLSARVEAALAPEAVEGVVRTYADSVGQLAGDRRALATTVAFAVTGWVFFLLPLYTSFLAIGDPVPYALVVFAVPVVTLLNVVPLPGGLGGFEVALAGVTAAVGGLDLSTATAAVFLFRLSNYWFLVLVGGLAAASLSVHVSDPPPLTSGVDEPDEA